MKQAIEQQRTPMEPQQEQQQQPVQQQQQEATTTVHLSWCLVAQPCHQQLYAQSREAQAFVAMVDFCGLIMTLINLGGLLQASHNRAEASTTTIFMHTCVYSLMALSLLQLAFAVRHWPLYYRLRTALAVANRLVRAAACLVPAFRTSFSVATAWIKPDKVAGTFFSSPGRLLAAYVGMAPLMHFHMALNFMLPTQAAVYLQLVCIGTAAAMVHNTRFVLQQIAGMPQAAISACSAIRGVFDLVLYFMCDLGTMPGVPAASLNSFGLPSLCDSAQAATALLLVYANLMISYVLPVFLGFVIELEFKLSFWKSQQVNVVVDRSIFLPLPSRPWLSYALFLCYGPMMVFYIAEQLTPFVGPAVQLQLLQPVQTGSTSVICTPAPPAV